MFQTTSLFCHKKAEASAHTPKHLQLVLILQLISWTKQRLNQTNSLNTFISGDSSYWKFHPSTSFIILHKAKLMAHPNCFNFPTACPDAVTLQIFVTEWETIIFWRVSAVGYFMLEMCYLAVTVAGGKTRPKN